MVRVISLLWTFVMAILITAISFFYVSDEATRGFPFSFAKEVVNSRTGDEFFKVNYWSVALDLIVWWLLFSMVWIVVKNYILELD